MTLFTRLLTVAFISSSTLVTVESAAQRSRAFSHSVRGPDGHGYDHSFSGSRRRGSGSATNRYQTADGRGLTGSRAFEASDGKLTSNRTRTLDNGTQWGRTTNATANGDGSADYSRTWSGPAGATATRSGTVGHR